MGFGEIVPHRSNTENLHWQRYIHLMWSHIDLAYPMVLVQGPLHFIMYIKDIRAFLQEPTSSYSQMMLSSTTI